MISRSGAIALLLALAASAAAAQTAPPRRPNILLVIADDWSFPHAGVYGDVTVKTPNFDRIAREGVRFTHAFMISGAASGPTEFTSPYQRFCAPNVKGGFSSHCAFGMT
jgi:hypothetical protein